MDVDILRTSSGLPVPGIDTVLAKQVYRPLANDRSGVALEASSAAQPHGGREPIVNNSAQFLI